MLDVKVSQDWPTGLGRWVGIQRKLYKEGSLLLERQKRLEEIGFVWNAKEKRSA